MEKTFYERVSRVQVELKAPKNQFNKFGNFKYRNCEDILESVKPLLLENNLLLFIKDEVVHIDNRFYVKATISLCDCKSNEKIETTAFAREEENKKGMDGSQVTGASSSYARKYALNGLFCIDDTKDSDFYDNAGKGKSKANTAVEKELSEVHLDIIAFCNNNEKTDELTKIISNYKVKKIHELSETQAKDVLEKLRGSFNE